MLDCFPGEKVCFFGAKIRLCSYLDAQKSLSVFLKVEEGCVTNLRTPPRVSQYYLKGPNALCFASKIRSNLVIKSDFLVDVLLIGNDQKTKAY